MVFIVWLKVTELIESLALMYLIAVFTSTVNNSTWRHYFDLRDITAAETGAAQLRHLQLETVTQTARIIYNIQVTEELTQI